MAYELSFPPQSVVITRRTQENGKWKKMERWNNGRIQTITEADAGMEQSFHCFKSEHELN